jgi:hypothetical protein
MSAVSPQGLGPFFNIFFQPRATIRAIVDVDPRLHVVPIALIAGGLSAIPSALIAGASGPVQQAGPFVAAFATVFGAVLGVIGLYVSGWLLTFTGWQLGGTATPRLVRAAVAWSNVPSIVGSAIGIVALVTGMAAIPAYDAESAFRVSGALSGLNPVFLGFAIWSFVISLICLSEVNGFSVVRALLTYFLIVVEVGIIVAILVIVSVGVPGFVR